MDQLEKILALVDSSHEGEALGALRMARRLLAKKGLKFKDLAEAAGRSHFSFRSGFFSGTQAQLEAKVEQLQDDIAAHLEQNESLTMQIEFWRNRAFDLEQSLNLNQAETERWKRTARETAERLWDLGKLARAEAFLSEKPFEEEDTALEPSEEKAIQEDMKEAS